MSPHAPSGLLLVISGPSGVGKTTIVHRVRERLGGRFSVSATTRPKSPVEIDGEDYRFVSGDTFKQMMESDAFLEHAEVFGRHAYGTPRRPVEQALREGELIILDIDVQGATQIREHMPTAYMIFILPPNDEELQRRLETRGREDEEAIARRFAEARREIDLATSRTLYDAFIVNDNLDRAVDEACRLVSERRHTTAIQR
ncbi:MAG: guanylate kinase [Phycisphaerales bacterium]|nr:guanylate kinase [Planctomycetaceae bacterium]MDP6158670.1 guanylate kinase [Phycisphaerales bacterium]MDP6310727.1 guanylate kinase [Phycisphaerales bacterium]MDP7088010.1 guanylate kinase [Phycisphaerales bacterium]MDP7189924.1 guanylate kinase [Phycisphaerales bacterium]